MSKELTTSIDQLSSYQLEKHQKQMRAEKILDEEVESVFTAAPKFLEKLRLHNTDISIGVVTYNPNFAGEMFGGTMLFDVLVSGKKHGQYCIEWSPFGRSQKYFYGDDFDIINEPMSGAALNQVRQLYQ